MTHTAKRRFRRGALALFAAVALAGGAVSAASAATTGSQPNGGSSYGEHHKPARHCEFDWLSGFTTDHDGQAQDVGYGQPSTLAPYGQPTSEPKAERVEAVQLVRVCETGEHLTVTDIGRPYVQETEPPSPPVYDAPTSPSPSAYVTPSS
jgi:hypothetical protein